MFFCHADNRLRASEQRNSDSVSVMLATVCELLSKGIATVCVEKAETKCVSLKHLPQRWSSTCGANCESATIDKLRFDD